MAGSSKMSSAQVIAFAPTILFVGDLGRWPVQTAELKENHVPVYASYLDVTPELVANLRPDTVVSPLFAHQFDAAEMAMNLQLLGFDGRYRAVTGPIPRPWVVLREVRAVAPKINFDLWFSGAF